tara:strand:- start:64 stop:246 length:183 start_codon:yes stop_codon:yes gene_type:complete
VADRNSRPKKSAIFSGFFRVFPRVKKPVGAGWFFPGFFEKSRFFPEIFRKIPDWQNFDRF